MSDPTNSTMRLREQFAMVKARERDGSRSADRFEYQKHWALCHVLNLHESGGDYLIAFDLHDDVIEFDSSEDPEEIRFYQVKTKSSGAWNLTELLKRKRGKVGPLPSIVGKMYFNKIIFPQHASALVFVTNAALNLPLRPECAPFQRVPACALSAEALERISAQLKEEYALDEPPVLETLLTFEVTDLNLHDYVSHAKGKLVEFLERAHPTTKFQIGGIYKALLSEVTIRNNCQVELSCFEDVAKRKGISREYFCEILGIIGVGREDFDARWQRAEAQLSTDHMPILRIRSVRAQWRVHEVDRLDPGNLAVRELCGRIKGVVAQAASPGSMNAVMTLPVLLDWSIQEIRERLGALDIFGDDYLRAAVLMELYES